MDIETRNDFRLNFLSNRSEMMTVNVPMANTAALPEQITQAMQAIIDSDAVESARGRPLHKYSAQLVLTERSDINVQTA